MMQFSTILAAVAAITVASVIAVPAAKPEITLDKRVTCSLPNGDSYCEIHCLLEGYCDSYCNKGTCTCSNYNTNPLCL